MGRKAGAILRFCFQIAAAGYSSRDSSLTRVAPFVPTLPRIISWPSDRPRVNGPESLIDNHRRHLLALLTEPRHNEGLLILEERAADSGNCPHAYLRDPSRL